MLTDAYSVLMLEISDIMVGERLLYSKSQTHNVEVFLCFNHRFRKVLDLRLRISYFEFNFRAWALDVGFHA